MSDVPTLARRHAAGVESARGLLFTVLGEFALPAGGSAWTSTVIEVLGRLGVEEKASRQALMRTAAAGWVRSVREGRRSRWVLTDAGSALLSEGSARIYGFSADRGEWDGRWLVVLARVPETERPARHRLRTRLAGAGLGSPSPGVWLSPHTDRLSEAHSALADAGVLDDAHIFLAQNAGGADPRELVRQAWDLDLVESAYEAFLVEFADDEVRDPLTRLVELVHAWRRFPWTDPVLPRELLPTPWSGERAAALFARRHARWAPAARAEWARLDD